MNTKIVVALAFFCSALSGGAGYASEKWNIEAREKFAAQRFGMKARDALALMNCSRRAAEMRFRAATGMSPLEAIDKVRLDRAVELLAVRDMSLSAVAEKTAFANETMFRRFFKRHAGLSPQDWRQENCR